MANGIENDLLRRLAESQAFAESQTPAGAVPGSLQDPFSLENELRRSGTVPFNPAAQQAQPGLAGLQAAPTTQPPAPFEQGGPAPGPQESGEQPLTGLAGLAAALSAIDPRNTEFAANALNPAFQTSEERAAAAQQRQAAEKAAREILRIREQERLIGGRQANEQRANLIKQREVTAAQNERAKLDRESAERLAKAANQTSIQKATLQQQGATQKEQVKQQEKQKKIDVEAKGALNQGESVLQNLNTVEKILTDAIEQGKTITGPFIGPFNKFIGRKELQDLEVLLSPLTLDKLTQLKGSSSDKELKFIQDMISSPSLQQEVLLDNVRRMKQNIQNDIGLAQSRLSLEEKKNILRKRLNQNGR